LYCKKFRLDSVYNNKWFGEIVDESTILSQSLKEDSISQIIFLIAYIYGDI